MMQREKTNKTELRSNQKIAVVGTGVIGASWAAYFLALWREAFSLVENGVVTVADIDTAISQGPGLRWALLGPFLNLHASGGAGGITHVLEHIGRAQREWARDLGEYPETDDYIGLMAAGVDEELQGCDFAETHRTVTGS